MSEKQKLLDALDKIEIEGLDYFLTDYADMLEGFDTIQGMTKEYQELLENIKEELMRLCEAYDVDTSMVEL